MAHKPRTRKTGPKARTDDVKRPKKELCCCGPTVLLSGDTSLHCCTLGHRVEEDELFQVRADANASVRPPGGPDTNADGSGGSELRTRLRKEIDAIALIKSFTFRWRVETTCRPVRVTVTISGDVNTYIDCASETGSTELSSIKFLEAAEINSDSSSALITVDAIDCTGETSSCSLELKI